MEKKFQKEYSDLIIRSAKKKFYYEYSDELGHVFYNNNRTKALRFTSEMKDTFIEGKRLEIIFNKSRLSMYADWSLKEAKIKIEEEQQAKASNKRELETKINVEVKNDDPDLLRFHEFIAECYGSAKPITEYHKGFIYAIRHKHHGLLLDALGHGKGWNDASKKFFTVLTGVKLPNTKKGILEVLEDFCGETVTT